MLNLFLYRPLGGSWKRSTNITKSGRRLLHGRNGKGRFKAFSLGKEVEWKTWFKSDGNISTYNIVGNDKELGKFHINDVEISKKQSTGTEVIINEIKKNFTSLQRDKSIDELTDIYALYISEYPKIKIKYDSIQIDPSSLMERKEDIKVEGIELKDGKITEAYLTVIEWKTIKDRKLYLCDNDGFTYHDMPPGVHAPGFNFTAYLKSDTIRELAEEELLVFEELHEDVKTLIESAKASLKEYFRGRSSELAVKIVDQWKIDKIYPYTGKPKNIIEKTERQVFDICALNLNEYLPAFEESDIRSKSLALSLLKYALMTSPNAVKRIFNEVLELPLEKQEEFAQLIENVSLEAVISASKIVTDRLDFLRGLEILVFEEESRDQIKERSQLHRIVAEHTWIFGEEFNLTSDDKSLTDVLKKHIQMGSVNIVIDEPVVRENGSKGIIDLMLSRRVPLPRADEREHLIIELKRPRVKIDSNAIAQLRSYAFAICEDERFKDLKTRWIFWALSNEITKEAQREANQDNRPSGLLYKGSEGINEIEIWIKTWGQIINDCKARLNFFQKELQYAASREAAINYLRSAYEKYLPGYLKNE